MRIGMTQYNFDRTQHGYEEEILVDTRGRGNSHDLIENLRSLKVEIRSCKIDNASLIKAQGKKDEVNAITLQSLSDLQRQS